MEGIKGLLASKTFWGIVLMVAARFLPALTDVSAADVANAFDMILTGVGVLLAIYGRITASKKIKGLL